MEIKIPWVEKYRPKDLDSIIIQPSLKKVIASIMAKGANELPNLLFEGPPGTGKTTLAKIIADQMGMTMLYLNASEESGIDTVRTKMKTFCSTMALDDKLKLVVCDEADGLSKAAQDSLRNLIESVHQSTRFIFTCNHPEKISPALKSRLKEVYFEQVEDKLILKRVGEILRTEKIEVPKEQMPNIIKLVKKHYPDIRKTINHLQFFSSTGTLEINFEELQNEDIFASYVGMIKRKKLSEIRELLRNNKLDYEGLIRKVYNSMVYDNDEYFKDIKEPIKAEAIILCAEYIHRSLNFVIDREINFADFSIQLFLILGKNEGK
jgi:DNA polymerase III delta prime subunit